ncbi:hypothetical protein EOM82_05750 [bacterium]|nr:hypothetical protein [bacterium]
MKTTAIICEYNPFTNGHLLHLKAAREQTGADTVICIMSGSFTQRGDAAILDKYQRAEIACRLGADMVVELPTIYAISPADNFAYGAVKIISTLPNVEYISFGSECGDAALLTKAAELLSDEPSQLSALIKDKLSEGSSYPKARSLALIEYSKNNPEYNDIADILEKPNNVLGIAYIQALKKLGLNTKIHTIKRITDYNCENIEAETPSASAIRMAIRREKFAEIQACVPPITYNFLKSYNTNGTPLEDLCLFKLKDISGFDLEKYYDVNGGLHNRIKLAAAESVTFQEFLEKAKTKKYTMAKLKRIALYTLFDITQEMYDNAVSLPPYVYILALKSSRKDEILSALNQTCENVLVRYSDIDKVDKSLRYLIKLDFKAQGVLNIVNRSNYFNRAMILV